MSARFFKCFRNLSVLLQLLYENHVVDNFRLCAFRDLFFKSSVAPKKNSLRHQDERGEKRRCERRREQTCSYVRFRRRRFVVTIVFVVVVVVVVLSLLVVRGPLCRGARHHDSPIRVGRVFRSRVVRGRVVGEVGFGKGTQNWTRG